MENTKHIFGEPISLDGVGNIYPIKAKEYNDFTESSHLIRMNNKHFGDENCEFKLLDIIIVLSEDNPEFIRLLEKSFSSAMRKEVIYVKDELDYSFIIDEEHAIHRNNYDQVRSIIMEQNLMYEEKVYKNKLVAKWARKAMEARSKNGTNITLESILSTVSVSKGVSYEELKEYTYYQIMTDFNRICKLMEYETQTLFATVSTDIELVHFAEHVNPYKNPYDDLFVSQDKYKNLNDVMKG